MNKKLKYLMLPLFLLPIMCGCNINNNENTSVDNSVISISSNDTQLINTYRIGSRDFDTKTYLYWWINYVFIMFLIMIIKSKFLKLNMENTLSLLVGQITIKDTYTNIVLTLF